MSPPARPSGPLATAAPFETEVPTAEAVPVVIAVPHAGRAYDAALIAGMRDPSVAAARLEDRHADTLARAVCARVAVPVLIATAPRAAIDLNRSEYDVDWSAIAGGPHRAVAHSAHNRRARSGLGLIPRRLPGTGEIWARALPREELDRRIAAIHRPYHAQLADMLRRMRDRWGTTVLLDLHSMPPLPQARGEPGPARFVIGDRFGASCHPALSARALAELGRGGWPVAHNRPYAGGHVLETHGRPRHGVHAIQIEICRSTYLDAGFERPDPAGMATIAEAVAGLVRAVGDEALALVPDRPWPEAAE